METYFYWVLNDRIFLTIKKFLFHFFFLIQFNSLIYDNFTEYTVVRSVMSEVCVSIDLSSKVSSTPSLYSDVCVKYSWVCTTTMDTSQLFRLIQGRMS